MQGYFEEMLLVITKAPGITYIIFLWKRKIDPARGNGLPVAFNQWNLETFSLKITTTKPQRYLARAVFSISGAGGGGGEALWTQAFLEGIGKKYVQRTWNVPKL